MQQNATASPGLTGGADSSPTDHLAGFKEAAKFVAKRGKKGIGRRAWEGIGRRGRVLGRGKEARGRNVGTGPPIC